MGASALAKAERPTLKPVAKPGCFGGRPLEGWLIVLAAGSNSQSPPEDITPLGGGLRVVAALLVVISNPSSW